MRSSAAVIRDLHRGAADPERLADLNRQATAILADVQATPSFATSGFVQQALGEYAEARLLLEATATVPTANSFLEALPVDALLLGVADAIGELRRRLLDQLVGDHVAEARRTFAQMESLYEVLTDSDLPEALVGLRAKRDQARAIVERTRGDIMTAKKAKDLEKRIDGLSSMLDDAETRGRPKKKPPAGDDLDLDAAWSKK